MAHSVLFIRHFVSSFQSGGVMFSPLGRLRVAQAVRKQISQIPVLSESAPLPGPLCYQLVCAPPMLPPCAPCDIPPPYAVYPVPFESRIRALGALLNILCSVCPTAAPPIYGPPQYTLVPAAYGCCEPCCGPDKRPPAPLHPAYIY
ncbi:hypothetical protein EVAR_24068_1 [Eumeta japonica]|uniref:Uncharacterized protein n=1 Tax=Eumeta variegata TaxID=151549 RepID=A0A4C1VRI9_EUMVA|nr:hypothetical protein EVAR_24068_1 [Eumeta japonica]